MPKLFYLKHWQVILLIYGPAMAFTLGFWIIWDKEVKAVFQVLRGFWIQTGLVIWFWIIGHYLYSQARQAKAWELMLFRVSLLTLVVIESFDLMAWLQYVYAPATPNQMVFAGLTDRLLLLTLLPIFYRALFLTRYFKSQQLDRRISGPAITFFVTLLFSPIGILLIQPQLNRLALQSEQ